MNTEKNVSKAKDYVKQFNYLNKRIEQLQLDILAAETDATKCTAKLKDTNVKSSGSDRTDIYDTLIELKKELEKQLIKRTNLYVDFEQKLAKIGSPELELILVYRYKWCMNWADIAHKLRYDYSTVHRKHSKALIKLQKMLEN